MRERVCVCLCVCVCVHVTGLIPVPVNTEECEEGERLDPVTDLSADQPPAHNLLSLWRVRGVVFYDGHKQPRLRSHEIANEGRKI